MAIRLCAERSRGLRVATAGLGVPEANDGDDHNSHYEDKPGCSRAHNEGKLFLELLGTGA